jgi:hypothetical protein
MMNDSMSAQIAEQLRRKALGLAPIQSGKDQKEEEKG